MRFIVLTAAFTGATTAAAGTLPSCGFRCFGNMLDLAVGLGCPPLADGNPDGACLCEKYDFGYGIRDCARESCPPEHVPAVINYGVNWCKAAAEGVTKAGKIAPTTTPAAVTALTAVPGASSSSSSSSTWKTTVPAGVVKTFTSGDKTFTTTVPTSVAVHATGVDDKKEHAASTTTTSDIRGPNKDVESTSTSTISTTTTNTNTLTTKANVAATTETTTEAVVSTTATATEEATVVSEAAAAAMFTGFVNAPLAMAAAAFLVL
ncbi:hypothetical protein V8F33_009464 [Rhypophila sp. PSN 637]